MDVEGILFHSGVDNPFHCTVNKQTLFDILPKENHGLGAVQELIDLLIVDLNERTFAKEFLVLLRLSVERKRGIIAI